MKATSEGVEISKAELGALLYFAGKTDSAGVHFRVNGHRKLVVSAGDGKRSAQCTAPGGDAEAGEWNVSAFYLERVRVGMVKGRTDAVLEFTAKGLKQARLVGAASRSKLIKIEDETNGTSTQTSFEDLRQLAKSPNVTGSWFALVPKQVNRSLDVLSKAADGAAVTYYPPSTKNGQLLLECEAEDGCKWLAALPTALVDEPGERAESDEDNDEDGPPGRPAKANKQPDLPNTEGASDDDEDADNDEGSSEGDDSGVVDDSYAEKLKSQKGPKKKAAKKAASKKKASKKK